VTAAEDVIEAEIIVDEPGVYDMPEDAYHADPVPGGSLSASGAKLLLPPSCPALYRYRRDHPKESAAFDYGTAAHKYVLGEGPPVTVVEGDRWDTKVAKAEVAAIREAGGIALKRRDLDQVEAMAAGIRAHPLASALFDTRSGEAEQSLFWVDGEFGIWRRARLDWLPWTRAGRRLIIGDYKTAAAVDPDSVRKAVANFGYYISAAQYIDGATALGLDDDPAFLLVFQMKEPPYLVNVVQLDDDAIRAGRERMRTACEMFRDCTESDCWPGYPDDIETISLPPWVRHVEEYL
jgi:PDDEXK-like domain of unknown function (DUF3799)